MGTASMKALPKRKGNPVMEDLNCAPKLGRYK